MKSSLKYLVPKPVRRAIWWFIEEVPNPYTFRPRRYALPLVYNKRKKLGGLEVEMHRHLLKTLVRSDSVALDIGANIGCYSYALSRLCRRVEAFEPNPLVAEVLQSYRGRNICVHNVGLSSEAGSMDLHVPVVNGIPRYGSGSLSNRFGESEKCFTVPVKRLDDFEIADVSFAKIDVEGHEIEVLKGGETTIRRDMPTLLVEIEQRHHSGPIQEVFDLLQGWGYRGAFLDDGNERPLAEFSVEQHQVPFAASDHRYINNFIFQA